MSSPHFDAHRIFAALWAIGAIAHPYSYGASITPLNLLFFATAMLVVFRPASLPALLGLACIQIADTYLHLPVVANHYLFAAFVNLTILLSAACLAASKRSWRLDAGELHAAFAPALRIELLVLYFFAVLHKLNASYLDPDASCAALMYSRLAHDFPVFPIGGWAKLAAVHGSLWTEAVIGALLFSRRFCVAGMILGAVFHTLLAFESGHVFFNFTAMLLGLYYLFAPAELTQAIWQVVGSQRSKCPVAAMRAAAACAVVVVAATTFRNDVPTLVGGQARGLWFVYAAGLALLLGAALRRLPRLGGAPEGRFRLCYAVLALGPALVALNGAMPYLGLKTETSFSMFSNLRTEGGVSNHLLIPPSWQLWDYQRDLVKVLATDRAPRDRTGRRLARPDDPWQWPYFELQLAMSRSPDSPIVYERGGRIVTLPAASADPDLVRRPSLPLRKLLFFRAVPGGPDKNACVH